MPNAIDSAKPPSVAYVVTRLSRQQPRPFVDELRHHGFGRRDQVWRDAEQADREVPDDEQEQTRRTGRIHAENRTRCQSASHGRLEVVPRRRSSRCAMLYNQMVNY